MKVSKSLLQTIALALVVGSTLNACSSAKEQIKPDDSKTTVVTPSPPPDTHTIDNCPACGMG